MNHSVSASSLRTTSSRSSLRSSSSAASLRGGRSRRSRESRDSCASLASKSSVSTIDTDSLRAQFDSFDKDGSGYLERDECIAALAKLGTKVTFESLDNDGDARISFEEFTMVTQLSGTHKHPIFKSAQQHAGKSATGISMFAGDAHLNEAFMQTASNAWRKAAPQLKSSMGGKMNETSLTKAFRRMDEDGSGQLTENELRKVIKTMAPQLTDVDVKLMIACADTDASGFITESEFVTMLMHDHQDDVPYWEKYGARDMHVGLSDRKDQVRY